MEILFESSDFVPKEKFAELPSQDQELILTLYPFFTKAKIVTCIKDKSFRLHFHFYVDANNKFIAIWDSKSKSFVNLVELTKAIANVVSTYHTSILGERGIHTVQL